MLYPYRILQQNLSIVNNNIKSVSVNNQSFVYPRNLLGGLQWRICFFLFWTPLSLLSNIFFNLCLGILQYLVWSWMIIQFVFTNSIQHDDHAVKYFMCNPICRVMFIIQMHNKKTFCVGEEFFFFHYGMVKFWIIALRGWGDLSTLNRS